MSIVGQEGWMLQLRIISFLHLRVWSVRDCQVNVPLIGICIMRPIWSERHWKAIQDLVRFRYEALGLYDLGVVQNTMSPQRQIKRNELLFDLAFQILFGFYEILAQFLLLQLKTFFRGKFPKLFELSSNWLVFDKARVSIEVSFLDMIPFVFPIFQL